MPWMEILMLAIGVALVTMICGGTFPPSGAGSALRCPESPRRSDGGVITEYGEEEAKTFCLPPQVRGWQFKKSKSTRIMLKTPSWALPPVRVPIRTVRGRSVWRPRHYNNSTAGRFSLSPPTHPLIKRNASPRERRRVG